MVSGQWGNCLNMSLECLHKAIWTMIHSLYSIYYCHNWSGNVGFCWSQFALHGVLCPILGVRYKHLAG